MTLDHTEVDLETKEAMVDLVFVPMALEKVVEVVELLEEVEELEETAQVVEDLDQTSTVLSHQHKQQALESVKSLGLLYISEEVELVVVILEMVQTHQLVESVEVETRVHTDLLEQLPMEMLTLVEVEQETINVVLVHTLDLEMVDLALLSSDSIHFLG
jgi:hypothetical protein